MNEKMADQHLSIDYVYMTAGTEREGEGPRFIDGTQQADHQQYVFFLLSFLFLLLTYFNTNPNYWQQQQQDSQR